MIAYLLTKKITCVISQPRGETAQSRDGRPLTLDSQLAPPHDTDEALTALINGTVEHNMVPGYEIDATKVRGFGREQSAAARFR